MGGAQPLAASLAGACSLNIECQQSRIDFRLKTRYVDEQAHDIDDALARIEKYTKSGEAKSIALLGNAAEILPELVKRGVKPDAVTDQTSAHDPVNGYLPIGWTVGQWIERRATDPNDVRDAAKKSMRVHVEAMLAFHAQGIPTVDYGNNIRQMAKDEGCANAFDFPGFVPAYVRPLFCRGVHAGGAHRGGLQLAAGDHLDSGSVASPNRETEAMKDGSDAVSDWPILNALLNTAGGATWVSFHHGGGVGMGYSQHSGVVIVCDGSEAADKRIARVLWNDPGTGVMRHADAGYEIAQACAKEQGLKLPMS